VTEVSEAAGSKTLQTDEELVQLILAGEVDVFALLYERFYSRAYRLAYGMTGAHDAAEDVTQEIFARAYQKLAMFGGQSSFSTWFYRLAFNRCLNFRKSDARHQGEGLGSLERVSLESISNQVENDLLHSQIRAQIQKAILSLKPKFRMVIILRDIEGLSYEEIAEQKSCSVGTLATQLKRARRLLAGKLEHLRGTFQP
jgi:RNA polymerase sigma-70 factor (ECF subfamily)